jgi:phytoene dehydrogenase-like protein
MKAMTKIYDTIIVGGGHNGLVCATYLAKAGKSVLVLEALDQVGGAAQTHDLSYGKKVSSCAHYLNQLNSTVSKDLNLASHGLKMSAKDVSTIALNANGNHLTMTKSNATGAGISEADAKAYTKFMGLMRDYARTLNFLVDIPPIDIFNPDWADKVATLKLGWKLRFGLGATKMSEFLRQIGMNIYDALDDEFDHALLKGALGFDAVLGTHTGPRSPGSVFTFLYRTASGDEGALGVPEGGMGSLTKAMAEAAKSAGVEIRTSSRVAKVNVENCKVTGVTLENGDVLNAHTVASNADPKTTVMDIVGPRHFEADFVKRIDIIRMRGTAAKLHISLGDLPNFTGLDADDLQNRLVIAPTPDEVEHAFNHVKYGEVSAHPCMEISIPSIADKTLAEKGHVLTATVQYAPYNLKGGWTSEAKAAFLETCVDRIREYAPDIRNHIEHAELLTPQDLEARFGMKGGNWHHGELTLDQMMMLRPTPEASRYALPLTGMYLCGAGAHPGGGVMGAAGKNAAQAILKGDLA